MTLADLEHFRNLLLERESSLTQVLNITPPPKEEDVQQVQSLLTEIKDALGRVDNKSYGECEVCKGEVEHHRLEVQPTVKVCLECITRQEQTQLEEELTLAGKIHRALLPQEAEKIEGYDLSVKSISARIVGGDYYDFLPAGHDRRARIVIADAMGKGLPAGFLMSNIRGALRILSEDIVSPQMLVTRLNRWLCRNIPTTKFFSLSCVAIESGNTEKSHLTYTNAGHCPPILVRRNGEIDHLEPTGGVLGVHENFTYEEKGATIDRGDLLILFTDGVTEAENKKGDMFGEVRLAQFLKVHRQDDLDSLLNIMLNEVFSFSGCNELEDDYTVIAIRKL